MIRGGRRATVLAILCLVLEAGRASPVWASSFVAFESLPARPLALSADGRRLYVLNLPAARLEIFAIGEDGPRPLSSVPVGLEPVALGVRTDTEVWVVNHLSDSVSVVDVGSDPPRVIRTLWVGDEPGDIVFAGPHRKRAFVTTAHRGQNSPIEARLDTPGLGRADVWVFDAESLATAAPAAGSSSGPETILSLFGDTPRALAVSPDGSTVYAAVFKSGNRTTSVSAFAVCDGGELAPACVVQGKEMPGGLPGPNESVDGQPQPRTGLLVKQDPSTGAWLDAVGRDWRNAVPIALPDKDVFVLDAMADPPREVGAYQGVGTILYAMATNPKSGALYVAATEARNELRFEPNLRGHAHETRLAVVDAQGVRSFSLNPHIDYSLVPSPEGTAGRSLALPSAVAVRSDGEEIWIAAMGSSRVAILPSPSGPPSSSNGEDAVAVSERIDVSGGGPVGVVLDEGRRRAYVLTRFDNGLSTLDMDERREIAHILLPNPEPEAVRAGRRFFYDAGYTSSNGEAACASCHVAGDEDALAWDLGDPDLPLLGNPNPRNPITSKDPRLGPFFEDFHPLKGPMTTQTLRGLVHHSPMHWRGDRTGALVPGGDAYDDLAALRQFNGAFVSLLGRRSVLAEPEMEALARFLLSLTPPPNPLRNLDDSLTDAQQAARVEFFRTIQGISCATCHVTDAKAGIFGSDRSASVNGQSAQLMKVPSLRHTYRKVGMFGMFPQLEGFMPSGSGDQVRGFGFLHDGATGVFIRRTFDYVMAFETNLAPMVGQQLTLTAASSVEERTRLDLMLERSAAGDCDLVAHAAFEGRAYGWKRQGDGGFRANRSAQPILSQEALRDLAASPGREVTFTCVPPGSGDRLGLDRDEDGYFDGDEIEAGSDPADPLRTPRATPSVSPTATPEPPSTPTPTVPRRVCAGDCDGGGSLSFGEIRTVLVAILNGAAQAPCSAADANGDGVVEIADLVAIVEAGRGACQG